MHGARIPLPGQCPCTLLYGQPPYGQPPYGPPPYGQPAYSQPLPYGMGYPPPPPQRQGLRWWQWLLMAIGGVAVIGCGCCGLAFVGAALGNHSGATTYISSGQGPAKVGDTIFAGQVACTLMHVEAINGDEFDQPKLGNEFIVVNIDIANFSSSEFNYSPFDFHVKLTF